MYSTHGVNVKLIQDVGQINLEGFYEHGNEFSGFIRGKKILGNQSDYQYLKNYSSLWSKLSIKCNDSSVKKLSFPWAQSFRGPLKNTEL
jgi:hypothetical protein